MSKSWITTMDYFATGEGFTMQIALVFAKTKKEAVEKHLDEFQIIEKSIRNYFRKGIMARSTTDKFSKLLFKETFVNGEKMLTNLANAYGRVFKYEYHFNFS